MAEPSETPSRFFGVPLRRPWHRWTLFLGVTLLTYGGLAVAMHYWTGEPWDEVFTLSATLAVGSIVYQLIVKARNRSRARRQR
jgi:NhaP-type Na+/H+ or K+/H+ antiporter